MFTKNKIFMCHNTSNWNEHVVDGSSGGIVKTLQNISPEEHAQQILQESWKILDCKSDDKSTRVNAGIDYVEKCVPFVTDNTQ